MKKTKKSGRSKKKSVTVDQTEIRILEIQQMWTVEQVAEFLNVKVRTVRRLYNEKNFPEAYRVGHRKRWYPEHVQKWLEWGSPTLEEFNRLRREGIKHDTNKKNKLTG